MAPKRKSVKRRPCRCTGVSQRVNVVTGSGAMPQQPIVFPIHTPTQMPQFVHTTSSLPDMRFSSEVDRIPRHNQQYVQSPGYIDAISSMPVAETRDVTRDQITPAERMMAEMSSEKTFEGMSVGELRDFARKNEIEIRRKARKEEIIDTIRRAVN